MRGKRKISSKLRSRSSRRHRYRDNYIPKYISANPELEKNFQIKSK